MRERRRHGLTAEQYETLKTRLREDLYKELWDEVSLRVGRGILSKGLYLIGTVGAAALAWLHGAGKIFGASE